MSSKYKKILFTLIIAGICTISYSYSTIPESDIAPHKALYDFRLISAETDAGISSIKGKIYFEQNDVCDAWTTNHRFTTKYHHSNEPTVISTGRYTAFESKDRHQFSFDSESQENGKEIEQLRGFIEISKEGKAKAVYSRPDGLSYNLPKNYLLPMAHTIEIIRRARAGEKFFSTAIFDGIDADGPVEIGAFIGKKVTADKIKKISGKNKKIDASLLTPNAWHIRMAVFPLKNIAESTPSYEMDIILHDNGIVSYTMIHYKTFKIEQTLIALEKLPSKKCH